MSEPLIRKVLFPIKPILGESLSGFVARAAAENRHGTTGLILEAAGYSLLRNDRTGVRELHCLPRLAEVLQCAQKEIADMSYPERGGGPKSASINFFGALVPRTDFQFRSRSVSPAALAASAHHRAMWSHRLLPYCPETGAILIDRCPAPDCGARLGWMKTIGIDFCEQCRGDLKAAHSEVVDASIRNQIDPVIALLNPDPSIHGPVIASLPEQLQVLNRGIVFELGWRLGALCSAVEGGMEANNRKRLSNPEKIEILSNAARVLFDWPDGFRKLAAGSAPERLAENLKWFRSPFHSGGVTSEIEPVIRESYPEILDVPHAFTAALSFFPDLVSFGEAVQMLHKTPSAVTRLHRLGMLPHAATQGADERAPNKRVLGAFNKSDVAVLAAKFADQLDATRCAYGSGIPLNGIKQLLCLGYLNRLDDPAVVALCPGLQLERSSFEALLDRIKLGSREVRGPVLSLAQAWTVIGGREKPVGPIVDAMLTGKLAYTFKPEGKNLARQIHVNEVDLAVLESMRFDADAYPDFSVSPTMVRWEAEMLLNLSPKALTEAVAARPTCKADGLLLKRPEVLEIAQQRIASSEIKRRWLGGAGKLPRALRYDHKLIPVDAFGRDRQEVESFFSA